MYETYNLNIQQTHTSAHTMHTHTHKYTNTYYFYIGIGFVHCISLNDSWHGYISNNGSRFGGIELMVKITCFTLISDCRMNTEISNFVNPSSVQPCDSYRN